MNAYNFWLFFFPKDFMTTSDTLKFMGLTLKSWGLIMFFTLSLVALLPLLKSSLYKLLKKEGIALPQSKIFIIAALIALFFFFFNTQMHERYSHPAILFLAVYALLFWILVRVLQVATSQTRARTITRSTHEQTPLR